MNKPIFNDMILTILQMADKQMLLTSGNPKYLCLKAEVNQLW